MDTQKSQPENQSSSTATPPVVTSCRKKKNEEATFLEDVKDHIDEFIHASMDEHKTCFKNTMQKVCVEPKLSYLRNCVHLLVNLHIMRFWFISDVWYVQGCCREEHH